MPNMHTRHSLADALNQAAEIEHMLCCSYLYAGFSLKKEPDGHLDLADTETTRKWAITLLKISRQEMEHLGMVCNLMSAIGVSPSFDRPNFPQSRSYFPLGIPLNLSSFSLGALENFINFEAPDHGTKQAMTKDPGSQFLLVPYTSLQGLYEYIKEGFNTLNNDLGPEVLFIGSPDNQITNENLFQESTKNYSVNLNGIMAKKPADRLAEAFSIIDQIITEGEGAINSIEGSHYASFLKIKNEYLDILAKKPGFVPAIQAMTNPQTFRHTSDNSTNYITHPLTLHVAKLFNLVYECVLLLLIRYYCHTDEDQAELNALQETAFFPLMTMGLRPLGEVLMQLPATNDNPHLMAGPTFEITRPLGFLPDKNAAWKFLQELLNETGKQACRAAELADAMQAPVAERLNFISLSLVRNAKNFGVYITGKEDI